MTKFVTLCLLIVALGGCVAGGASKPLSPTETQVITQVIAHRLIAPKLTASQRQTVLAGLTHARTALGTTSPTVLLEQLGTYLGPENADLAALITVLVRERVDLTTLPELEGKAYVWAVLTGIIEGI